MTLTTKLRYHAYGSCQRPFHNAFIIGATSMTLVADGVACSVLLELSICRVCINLPKVLFYRSYLDYYCKDVAQLLLVQ